ncbi:hypothetical protein LguiA_028734 [Lonicera macranthoides]
MESPGEVSTKRIDPSVGGLVWVRRRNGSWWPGRILGADELPDTCLISPRSGTPVKLLGRDDASVDWYNLEKSKRVKAFRCGEYDKCIEKAKAAAANSSKKAVKYARREDAIIQALELESARQPKDCPSSSSKMDEPGDEEEGGVKESPIKFGHNQEHIAEDLDNSEDNSNSAQELSQSGVSFEEPNQIRASKEQAVQGIRQRTPNDSEDDGTEGIKRMRGLEDLGMGVVSSFKRKRSQVAHVHEFLKRKNRRRQLTKVLESTAMITVPVMCQQLASPAGSPLPGVSESKVSGLESNESKRSFSVVINNNSDSTGISCENGNSLNASEHACDASLVNCKQKENEISSMLDLPENDSSDRLFDVPFVGEEKHPTGLSVASQKPQVGAGAQSSQSSQLETVSLGNEEFNESGSTSSGAADINNISHGVEKDTSKWQLKRKRNSRNASKNRKLKSTDADDVLVDSNTLGGSLTSDVFTCRGKSRPIGESHVDEFQGWTRNSSDKELHLTPQRSLPYRQSRFTVHPKYRMSDLSIRNYNVDSSLFDVHLEVKASHRPQGVPYISLMSKLNGRPITGHPITVEVLDDGFCELLIKGRSECCSSSCNLDVGLRGNVLLAGMVPPKKRLLKEPRFSPGKSPKARKNGLLSKKIRKLSSLTGSHKQIVGEKKPVIEKLKGPAVACVPLKVVFSRINAALNSSMRPVNRVMGLSNQ